MVRCGLASATPSPGLRAAIKAALESFDDLPSWVTAGLTTMANEHGIGALRLALLGLRAEYHRAPQPGPYSGAR